MEKLMTLVCSTKEARAEIFARDPLHLSQVVINDIPRLTTQGAKQRLPSKELENLYA
jgi:hypothetical protein